MAPKLGPPTTVRFSEEFQLELMAAAGRKGVPVSELVRERLEFVGPLQEALEGLRQDIAFIPRGQSAGPAQAPATAPEATPESAVQIETLMLLRSIAGPQRLREVHAELSRQGYRLWRGKVD